MKKNILSIFAIAVAVLISSGLAYSQTCTIKGRLQEGPAGGPLIGASVTIHGTGIGAIANINGLYKIDNVPVGNVTLDVIQFGSTVNSRSIFTEAGKTYGVNFWLNAKTDIDGNAYSAVEIGPQLWLGENLKVSNFTDGKPLNYADTPEKWISYGTSTTNGYCWYQFNKDGYGATYGGLYNWYAVATGKLCPEGWHVPTNDDWQKLTTYLAGQLVAGGKLKEAGLAHWTENTDATNESGFSALPGGMCNSGIFGNLNQTGFWWSSTEGVGTFATFRSINYYSGNLNTADVNKASGMSIRCINNLTKATVTTATVNGIASNSAQSGGEVTDVGGSPVTTRGVCWSTTPDPTVFDSHTTDASGTGVFTSNITGLEPNTKYYLRAYATNSIGTAYGDEISFQTYNADAVMDIDGNYYNTVAIGNQIWMQGNLKTTRYNNGDGIPLITDNNVWAGLSTPGYCYYNNDSETYKDTYGALYNWYAVDAESNGGKNVCPTGWHVPSYVEWTDLFNYLGGFNEAGGKLKATGTIEAGDGLWYSPNLGATNETGFTALPGGYRWGIIYNGVYGYIGSFGMWWSTTEYEVTPGNALSPQLGSIMSNVSNNNSEKEMGLSVRCLQGEGLALPTVTTSPVNVIGSSGATSGGKVTSNGGSPVTAQGVCWNDTQGPTISNSHTIDNIGSDNFISQITGLTAGMTYYVRAYATNGAGTAYGNEIVFTTPARLTDYNGNIYNTIIFGTQTWMQENLRTTKFSNGDDINNGTGIGDYSDEAAPNYYFSYGDNTINDAIYGKYYTWYTATDTRNLCPTGWRVPTQNDWQDLKNYLISNGFGYEGGSNVGKAAASSTGWVSDSNPGNVGNNQATNNSSGFNGLPGGNRNYGVANFYNFYGMGIYGRYQSVNEYDNWTAFMGKLDANNPDLNIYSDSKKHGFNVRCIMGEGTPLKYMPALNTTAPTNITASSVRTGGRVVTDGNATITERGICWNTSGNPTIGDNRLQSGSGLGEFSVDITSGLLPGTRYYAQAYAINNDNKVGYGDEVSFTTGGPGVLIDVDGNYYQTTMIGNQKWMTENLKVTHLNDGTQITYVEDYTQWGNSATPGFCWVLNNPGLLKDIYGALYNWYTVNTEKLCPQGWHVPSQDDWNILITSQGGASSAGAALKEAGFAHWYSPNTGTNSSGFTGLPGGYRMGLEGGKTGFFDWAYQVGYWWTSTQDESISGTVPWAWYVSMKNSESNVNVDNYQATGGMSVRCIMDPLPVVSTSAVTSITKISAQSGGSLLFGGSTPVTAQGVCWNASPNPTISNNHTTESLGSSSFTSQLEGLAAGVTYYVRAYATNSAGTAYGEELTFTTYRADAISDLDGNFYNIVKIGSQYWMQENLKTTRFKDSTAIPLVTNDTQWTQLNTPGYCWFNNDEATYKNTYGGMYNWRSVTTGKLCPAGWLIPTIEDWNVLRDYLGGEAIAGGKMKETGTSHWIDPNVGADNSSGFTGLPGGYRNQLGNFSYSDIGRIGFYWSSTDGGENHAFDKQLRNYDNQLNNGWDVQGCGFSVRCIMDQLVVTDTNDFGIGSLRNAIEYANIKPGKDTIKFDIQGTGPFTIAPQSELPHISDPVVIDGYSQAGSSPGTLSQPATIMIRLVGSGAGENASGIYLNAGNSVICGLQVNGFSYGIYLNEAGGNIVKGNLIGNTVIDYGNTNGIGVFVYSSENLIGGNAASDRNIVSGNAEGIRIDNTADGTPPGWGRNRIIGNYIGIDPNGKQALGNDGYGIYLANSPNNVIGGSVGEERNIISGNNDGIRVAGTGATGNVIKGNFIGTTSDGTKNIDNYRGISLLSPDNIVGGKDPGTYNLISGNYVGISIENGGDNNIIEGNLIGTDPSGTTANRNSRGIEILGGKNNLIGGSDPKSGNTIAFNNGVGISITNGTGNKILSNSIHSNGGLGIDLGTEGVTPNDNYDVDTGPNNLQNYPVIDTLNYTSGTVYIKGHLNSIASSQYTIEFFANKVADNTGYGEGRTFIGSETVTTNVSGNATFAKTFSRSSGWGDVITATATDAQGNTSEFSEAVGGLQDQIIAGANWPFHFKVNEDGVPRITDGSDITAVSQSFTTWQNVTTAKVNFVNDGTTTQKYASATDKVNLVSFVDNQFPFPPRVLAIAAKTLQVDPNDDVARIIDADIVVNPVFSDHDVGVGSGDFYDAQSIITHEIGHVMGLLHTGVVNSTMFYMLGYGTRVRSLEQDDRSWVSYKYPGTNYNSTFGSISGHISYGYGSYPVAGALVMAIRTSVTPNDTVHAYSDADGNYLVPGLPAGSYNIFIQPLDGNVMGYNLRPGNISTYIYCNTVYTDYPDEYLSVNETAAEPSDTPVYTATVNPGSNLTVGDIITNQDITNPTFISAVPTDAEGSKVNVLSDFVIKFSEPVDETSLTSQTCYLELDSPDHKQTGGSFVILSESPNVVIFNPESPLGFTSTYMLHLTSGIKDLKGNGLVQPSPVSFITVDKDGIPPTIKSTYPLNNAGSVSVADKIKVIFSEAMNTESLNDNFAVTWTSGTPSITNKVDGSITWDAGKTTLTFTPSMDLYEGTDYTISVLTGATDLSANNLAAAGSYTFSTVDVAAPVVKYIGPKDTQTGVTIETPIVADFSEPIDPSSITTSTFFLKQSTGSQSSIKGDFEFLNSNKRVVFKPESVLLPETNYTVTLTTGIKDVSVIVQHLAADEISTFKTAPAPLAPSISFITEANGKVNSSITISGAGFSYVPSENLISFNGVTTYAESSTLTSVSTRVPIGTQTGPVTVTVKGKISNSMLFSIIPDYMNDPNYATSSKSLPSGSSGGSAVSGSGDAAFALVTNPEGGTISKVVLSTGVATSTSTGGLYPLKVDIDNQGKYAYVTNFYSHDVSVIDLSNNLVTLSKVIPVGIGPFGVVVTPDGKRVYVSNYESGNLSMIDADPNSGGFDHVVANVPTGSNPGNIAVTGDAGMVLVTGPFGLQIVNSNPKSDDYNSVTGTVSTGTKTKDVTVTADAGFAIVATELGNLLIINLHPENDDYSGAVVASVPTGTKVSDVKASGDAVYVYATDTENNKVLVYKISNGGTGSSGGSSAQGITLIPLGSITVPNAPYSLAISPSGDKVYTVTSDPGNAKEKRITTISLTGLKISPENTIESLISTVQTLIDNKLIKKANGTELIGYLNSALSYLAAGKTKDAINKLNTFVVKVQDYIKSKQLTAGIGQPMIDAANAVIRQLQGIKSEENEYTVTGIDTRQVEDVITQTKLGVIYPNPSKDVITIDYEVSETQMKSGKVLIQVFDITGKVVGNLVNDNREPGRYSTTWSGTYENGSPAPRGIYFIRLQSGNVREVKQIMLVR